MAKDPAMLWYPSDYVSGTMGMSFEQKGAYMDLLMLQFNRGHMTEHMIGQAIGQLFGQIEDKFRKDEQGLWYNERLDIEKDKRKTYVQSRFNNKNGKNQHSKNEGHTTYHMEDVNINTIVSTNTVTNTIGEMQIEKLKLQSFEEIEIKFYNKCEDWQKKELVTFITKNHKNFEAIAIRSQILNKHENFRLALQSFVDMIQSTGEYQESNALARHFGNWLGKKNGTLEAFLLDYKSKITHKQQTPTKYIHR